MVLVCRLGFIDCVWHAAHDLGTSTHLVQGTQCKKYKIKIADCIYTHTIYILAWKITGSFRFEPIWTSSQNCWPLQTSNWTISPVLPRAQTLDWTTVRFCCVQVQTMVPNWTLPSLLVKPPWWCKLLSNIPQRHIHHQKHNWMHHCNNSICW